MSDKRNLNLKCFEKLVRRLNESERKSLIDIINSVKIYESDKLDPLKELVKVNTYCSCPFNCHASFGYNYYCKRERVTQLVDESGVRIDLRTGKRYKPTN